jgi:BMFP domain-containing protein YqiC
MSSEPVEISIGPLGATRAWLDHDAAATPYEDQLRHSIYPDAHSMTQSNNRFFDEFAKLMTDAAGAAQGMRREAETLIKSQGERMLAGMDLVQREEFEAVKAMAAKAREENEVLAQRLSVLEAELSALRPKR